MTMAAVHAEMFLQCISSLEKASRQRLRPPVPPHSHPSLSTSICDSDTDPLVPSQQAMESRSDQRKDAGTGTERGSDIDTGSMMEAAYTEYHYANKDFGPDSSLESAPHTYHYNTSISSSTFAVPDAMGQDHSVGAHLQNNSMVSVHAKQLQLLADFQLEFSQKVRLANAKRVAKSIKTDDIAANLAPIRLTHRLRELLECEEYWMRDSDCVRLISLLSTWTQLFVPLST